MPIEYGYVPGVDKPISRLVQGIIQVPGEEAAGFALLDAIYEQGINAVDTAHVYGSKDAFLGKWLKSRDLREKVTVLAKGCHHNDVRQRVTGYDIGSDLHDTLARMKTDYVDLYVLHRDDPTYPVEPIVDALNKYKNEGKIKAFGGSNWSTDRLQAAHDYAVASGQTPFAVSSPNFSLAEQVKEPWENCVTISGPQNETARQWYAERKMPLFTWSSLAGGFLTGKFHRDDDFSKYSEYHDKLAVECYCYPQNFDRVERAEELAQQKGLTVAQIAVAYILSYPLDIFALVGAATPDECKKNIEAASVKLTPGELAYLDLRADSVA